MKTILKNVLKAVGVIAYFLILAYATTKMDMGRLEQDIKIFAGAYLVIGILVLERAYKKDSGIYAITGVELLALSLHSLSIMHMVNLLKYELNKYLFISAIVMSIYYIIKGIIMYTKEKKDYLKGLSDIPDIVKEDEPVKKETKKREKSSNKIQKEETVDKTQKQGTVNKAKKGKTANKTQKKETTNKAQKGKTANKTQKKETTNKTQKQGTKKKR